MLFHVGLKSLGLQAFQALADYRHAEPFKEWAELPTDPLNGFLGPLVLLA